MNETEGTREVLASCVRTDKIILVEAPAITGIVLINAKNYQQ